MDLQSQCDKRVKLFFKIENFLEQVIDDRLLIEEKYCDEFFYLLDKMKMDSNFASSNTGKELSTKMLELEKKLLNEDKTELVVVNETKEVPKSNTDDDENVKFVSSVNAKGSKLEPHRPFAKNKPDCIQSSTSGTVKVDVPAAESTITVVEKESTSTLKKYDNKQIPIRYCPGSNNFTEVWNDFLDKVDNTDADVTIKYLWIKQILDSVNLRKLNSQGFNNYSDAKNWVLAELYNKKSNAEADQCLQDLINGVNSLPSKKVKPNQNSKPKASVSNNPPTVKPVQNPVASKIGGKSQKPIPPGNKVEKYTAPLSKKNKQKTICANQTNQSQNFDYNKSISDNSKCSSVNQKGKQPSNANQNIHFNASMENQARQNNDNGKSQQGGQSSPSNQNIQSNNSKPFQRQQQLATNADNQQINSNQGKDKAQPPPQQNRNYQNKDLNLNKTNLGQASNQNPNMSFRDQGSNQKNVNITNNRFKQNNFNSNNQRNNSIGSTTFDQRNDHVVKSLLGNYLNQAQNGNQNLGLNPNYSNEPSWESNNFNQPNSGQYNNDQMMNSHFVIGPNQGVHYNSAGKQFNRTKNNFTQPVSYQKNDRNNANVDQFNNGPMVNAQFGNGPHHGAHNNSGRNQFNKPQRNFNQQGSSQNKNFDQTNGPMVDSKFDNGPNQSIPNTSGGNQFNKQQRNFTHQGSYQKKDFTNSNFGGYNNSPTVNSQFSHGPNQNNTSGSNQFNSNKPQRNFNQHGSNQNFNNSKHDYNQFNSGQTFNTNPRYVHGANNFNHQANNENFGQCPNSQPNNENFGQGLNSQPNNGNFGQGPNSHPNNGNFGQGPNSYPNNGNFGQVPNSPPNNHNFDHGPNSPPNNGFIGKFPKPHYGNNRYDNSNKHKNYQQMANVGLPPNSNQFKNFQTNGNGNYSNTNYDSNVNQAYSNNVPMNYRNDNQNFVSNQKGMNNNRRSNPISPNSNQMNNCQQILKTCYLCDGEHDAKYCCTPMSFEIRQNRKTQIGLCDICLCMSHTTNNCSSNYQCKFCGCRHAAILCQQNRLNL